MQHTFYLISKNTFLPQRNGYKLVEFEKKVGSSEALRMIFDRNVQKIGNWDDVVFNTDSRDPDEGACVEIGITYALGMGVHRVED